ncbi:MAG: AI-2E family transporter [Desulfuromonas sp.]|nr:MAG: AI-2E family transporter [Desulfuromonas sp.]
MPRAPYPITRAQLLVFYLVFTAALATGLALYSSASNAIGLVRSATEGLFLPLLLALISTFLLDPLVRFFEHVNIRKSLCIFIVFFFISLLIMTFTMVIAPHWEKMWFSLQGDLPRYLARGNEVLNSLQMKLLDNFPFLQNFDLVSRSKVQLESLASTVLAATPKSAMRIGSLLVLVPFFTFFFLRDGRQMMRGVVSLTPNRHFEMVLDLYSNIGQQLAQFIRGRLLEALIVGLVVTLGLSLTDIRYAPFLGIFAGLANLVPYIGPLVGMVPGLLVALVDLGLGGQFWWILIVYLLIAQVIVDNFILIPLLISRVANLHPIWVVIAVITGGKLYGVIGMIIGVPIFSIIKIAVIETHRYRRQFAFSHVIESANAQPVKTKRNRSTHT